MNTANDWQYFRDNPERNFRMRIATPGELADLRDHGALNDDSVLAQGCSIFALARIDRTKAEVQKLLLVLDADASDMDEDDCKAAWRDADAQLLKSIIVRRLQ